MRCLLHIFHPKASGSGQRLAKNLEMISEQQRSAETETRNDIGDKMRKNKLKRKEITVD